VHPSEVKIPRGVGRDTLELHLLTDPVPYVAGVVDRGASRCVRNDVFGGDEMSAVVDKEPGAGDTDE
jgi:hypothetical protein